MAFMLSCLHALRMTSGEAESVVSTDEQLAEQAHGAATRMASRASQPASQPTHGVPAGAQNPGKAAANGVHWANRNAGITTLALPRPPALQPFAGRASGVLRVGAPQRMCARGEASGVPGNAPAAECPLLPFFLLASSQPAQAEKVAVDEVGPTAIPLCSRSSAQHTHTARLCLLELPADTFRLRRGGGH